MLCWPKSKRSSSFVNLSRKGLFLRFFSEHDYFCTFLDRFIKFLMNICEFFVLKTGNLYTHMRRHTGQLYRCPSCSFTTCNKTHLMEHIRTHRRNKQTCRMCSKKYTTEKSLMNHIRKYHRGQKGKYDLFLLNIYMTRFSPNEPVAQ